MLKFFSQNESDTAIGRESDASAAGLFGSSAGKFQIVASRDSCQYQLHFKQGKGFPDTATGTTSKGHELVGRKLTLQKAFRSEEMAIGVEILALVEQVQAANDDSTRLETMAQHFDSFFDPPGKGEHSNGIDAQGFLTEGAQVGQADEIHHVGAIAEGLNFLLEAIAGFALAIHPVQTPSHRSSGGFVSGKQQGHQFVAQFVIAEGFSLFVAGIYQQS